MKNSINCDLCNASKYAGYSNIVHDKEYCLLHSKYLNSTEQRTIPCEECNGKDFKEDTFAN